MPPLELEKGEQVGLALLKVMRNSINGAGLGFGGLCFLIVGALTIPTCLQKQWPLWLGVVGTLFFVAIGLILMLFGAMVVFGDVVSLLNKQRLVLGKRKLQSVKKADEVLEQVPYDNIDRIRLCKFTGLNNQPYRVIGVTLLDAERKDTVVLPVAHTNQEDLKEFDFVLFDQYDLPLENLYKKLNSRVRKVAREAAEDSGPPPDADLRG